MNTHAHSYAPHGITLHEYACICMRLSPPTHPRYTHHPSCQVLHFISLIYASCCSKAFCAVLSAFTPVLALCPMPCSVRPVAAHVACPMPMPCPHTTAQCTHMSPCMQGRALYQTATIQALPNVIKASKKVCACTSPPNYWFVYLSKKNNK